jgi:hypothetical protein
MDYGLFDKDKDFDGTKWIFPTAPILSITVNSGSRMNGDPLQIIIPCLLRAMLPCGNP